MLVHCTFTGDMKTQIYMKPNDKELLAQVIDIAAIYQGHITILPNIFGEHGLSGCDTVCSHFDIGKKTIINLLNKTVSI